MTATDTPDLWQCGVSLVELVDRAAVDQLRDEAMAVRSRARRSHRSGSDGAAQGDPDRALHQAIGGPVLDWVSHSGQLGAALRWLTGRDCEPLGSGATYSYYSSGDHLGPHLDVPGCDVTVVLVLHDDTPAGHPVLCWPAGAAGDSAVHREPTAIVARPGQAIVLLGRVVPHSVPPVPAGHLRIVAPICFRLPDS